MIISAVDKNLRKLHRVVTVPLPFVDRIESIVKEVKRILDLGRIQKIEIGMDSITYYQVVTREEVPTKQELEQLLANE